MEQLTISQAIIKLSDLEKSYNQKMNLLQQLENTTIRYVLELDNQKHLCNEAFEFEKVFNDFLEISNKIHHIKTEISRFNSLVEIDVLGTKMTIQGALHKSRMLRIERDMIENIINQSKSSKVRRVDAAATSVYYNVCEPNFDKVKMQEFLDSIDEKLLRLELAINKANNENVITIA